MHFDEKVALIESGFRELREALKELSKEIWREIDPTDSSAVDRGSDFQKRLIASFTEFDKATESIEQLLENRHDLEELSSTAEPLPSKGEGSGRRNRTGSWVEDLKGPTLPAKAKRPLLPAPVGANSMEKALDALDSLGPVARAGRAVNTRAAMLLAVARKIDAGEISSPEFEFNLALAGSFMKVLTQMGVTASNDDACEAFFALRDTNFWKLIPIPDREEEMEETTEIVSLNHLNRIVLTAELNGSLFQCLRDRQTSPYIQRTLITKFLPQIK